MGEGGGKGKARVGGAPDGGWMGRPESAAFPICVFQSAGPRPCPQEAHRPTEESGLGNQVSSGVRATVERETSAHTCSNVKTRFGVGGREVAC